MTLTELIEEEHGTITVTGNVPDVHRFAYCLEETISRGMLKDELEHHMQEVDAGREYIKQFNFSGYHRIYYDPGKILFGANVHDRKSWFPIIKKSYDQAMQLYLNTNNLD